MALEFDPLTPKDLGGGGGIIIVPRSIFVDKN